MTTKKYKHCVLALDHDRCGKFIKLSESGTVMPIVKNLAEVLKDNVGNSDECHYTLVSYSNRQSNGINWFLDGVKKSKVFDPRKNLTHLEEVQSAFELLQLDIKDVYDDYFLEDEMTEKFGIEGNFEGAAFRDYAGKNRKRSLRAAIQKMYPSPDTIIVYIDDEFEMLPTPDERPVEQDKYPGIGWIQFFGTMSPDQVQWEQIIIGSTKADTPVIKL